jgi:adenylate cyclase class 2
MEVEVKFRIEDPDQIEVKVIEFAEFVIDKIEEDIYFKSPVRDFTKTDEALRIRKDVEGVSITYKGPKIDAQTKTREEVKVRLNAEDYQKAVELLQKLGFERVAVVVKRRKIYRADDILICLDHLDGIGNFVEIEIESDNVEKAKKRIFEMAKRLGLEGLESIRKSYLEMLLESRVD